jgi:hypothetical protein
MKRSRSSPLVRLTTPAGREGAGQADGRMEKTAAGGGGLSRSACCRRVAAGVGARGHGECRARRSRHARTLVAALWHQHQLQRQPVEAAAYLVQGLEGGRPRRTREVPRSTRAHARSLPPHPTPPSTSAAIPPGPGPPSPPGLLSSRSLMTKRSKTASLIPTCSMVSSRAATSARSRTCGIRGTWAVAAKGREAMRHTHCAHAAGTVRLGPWLPRTCAARKSLPRPSSRGCPPSRDHPAQPPRGRSPAPRARAAACPAPRAASTGRAPHVPALAGHTHREHAHPQP